MNDNFLEWEVQLEGLKNTLWEGVTYININKNMIYEMILYSIG